jgi:predicted transcriptional regulator
MIKTNPVKNPTPQKLVKTVSQAIESRSHKIQDYPQPVRIATVKGLKEAKYSSRRIAKVLGLGLHTVQEYIDTDLDDEWQQYSNAVSKILTERSDSLKFLTVAKIEEKLQDVSNVPLRDLSGLYRVLNEPGVSSTQHSTLNQIINVHPALERKVIVQDQDA